MRAGVMGSHVEEHGFAGHRPFRNQPSQRLNITFPLFNLLLFFVCIYSHDVPSYLNSLMRVANGLCLAMSSTLNENIIVS